MLSKQEYETIEKCIKELGSISGLIRASALLSRSYQELMDLYYSDETVIV